MATSKKDFELVAHALNRAMRTYSQAGNALPRTFVALVIKMVADEFAWSSKAFNRTMFYRAVTQDLGALLREGNVDEQ